MSGPSRLPQAHSARSRAPLPLVFFFSSRRRHTRWTGDWSSDVCSSDLEGVFTALAYSFTDNIIGTFRYGYANRINHDLGTGGANPDLPTLNPIRNYHIQIGRASCRERANISISAARR